jgi:hypothetical protein
VKIAKLTLCSWAAVAGARAAFAQCPPEEVFGLSANDNQQADYFGQQVAVWEDVALVGAAGHGTGSVYVYERDPLDAHRWTLVTELSSGAVAFGFRIALHAGLAAVAAGDNLVRLYGRDAGGPNAWGLVRVLDNGNVPANADHFGRALAVWEDTVVVGAPYSAFGVYGSAHVFRRDAGGPGNWGRVKQLVSPLPNSLAGIYGEAVALHEDTLVVADPRWGNWEGNAYVYERDRGGPEQWGLTKVLGPEFSNAQDEQAGSSLAIWGDTAMVCVPALASGAVRVYQRDLGGADNWGLLQTLQASPPQAWAFFSSSIALDGARAVIGEKNYSGAFAAQGRVHVLEPLGSGATTWQPTAVLEASDALASDALGLSVGLWNETVVIGNDRNNYFSTNPGKVHVFDLESPQAPVSYCTAGTSSNGCSATLHGVGTASATNVDGFDLVAIGLDGQRSAAIFYGVSGPVAIAVPGTTSWRCVKAPVQRLGIVNSGGAVGACNGSVRVDWNAFRAANPGALGAPFAAGQTIWAQAWNRDALSPTGLPATQGLSFSLCP